MIGFIIWIIGVVLCVKAVLEIMKWPVDGVKKLLVAIIILLTSWRRVLRTRGIANSYPLLFRNSVGLSPNCPL